MRVVRIVLISIVVFTFLLIFGLMAAGFGWAAYEHRQHDALEQETKIAALALATGIVQCAADRGALPPTSNPVPARFDQVVDQRYQAEPSEWSASAWRCSGFSRPEQGYQIRWVRENQHEGFAIAIAKERDSLRLWTTHVDYETEVRVDCSAPGRCHTRTPVETSARPGLENGALDSR